MDENCLQNEGELREKIRELHIKIYNMGAKQDISEAEVEELEQAQRDLKFAWEDYDSNAERVREYEDWQAE